MHITRDIPATTGVGSSIVLASSKGPNNYQASLHSIIVAGTPTYNVEASLDGVVWRSINNGLTENSLDLVTTNGPINFVRINVTDDTGGGSVRGVLCEVC